MQGTRKWAFLLAVTMVVGTVSNSYSAAAATTAQSHQATAAIPPSGGYDGRTLYVGLAFGQGPVAALFPELEGLHSMAAGHEDYVNATVSEMASLDPTFFERFAHEIQSGDRVRIRAALAEADDLGAVAASRVGVNEPNARMVADQELILFIAAVIIVFVFAFIGPITAPTLQAQVAPLDRDLAADRIARVLHVDV